MYNYPEFWKGRYTVLRVKLQLLFSDRSICVCAGVRVRLLGWSVESCDNIKHHGMLIHSDGALALNRYCDIPLLFTFGVVCWSFNSFASVGRVVLSMVDTLTFIKMQSDSDRATRTTVILCLCKKGVCNSFLFRPRLPFFFFFWKSFLIGLSNYNLVTGNGFQTWLPK